MAKQIVYGEKTRQTIISGVDQLANAVKVTLGPKGLVLRIPHACGIFSTATRCKIVSPFIPQKTANGSLQTLPNPALKK